MTLLELPHRGDRTPTPHAHTPHAHTPHADRTAARHRDNPAPTRTPRWASHRDRPGTVAAEDGVRLAVREVGPHDAPITVIFVHGFCLHMGSWLPQRTQLERTWGPGVRMVFYDQRGHGQSGAAPRHSCTIAQTGRDLDTIIRALVPTGPIVLVGHSMGGMTILAYARQQPQAIGTRVTGVALIATAADRLTDSGVAAWLHNPAIGALRRAARTAPTAVHGARTVARRLIAPIMAATAYGDRRPSPRLQKICEHMINTTPITTIEGFLDTLEHHDQTAALPALATIPTLILCGTADMITPPHHSAALARQLPHAELIRVPGAGHMIELERPRLVSDATTRLVAQAIDTPAAQLAS